MIRIAEIKDLTGIMPMFRQFIKESIKLYKMNFDINILTRALYNLIENHFVIVMIDNDDPNKFLGGFAGTITPFLLGDGLAFQEIYFYLYPEYRKHSKQFLQSAEAILKGMGVKTMILGNPVNSENDQKVLERFYKMNGFEVFEKHYIKKI